MKKIILPMITLVALNSCSGLSEAGKVLRNEKTATTDEFLIKKKNPLVIPPNFEEIPEPGSILKKNTNDKNRIKEILNTPQIESGTKSNSSSIEKSILNKIRK